MSSLAVEICVPEYTSLDDFMPNVTEISLLEVYENIHLRAFVLYVCFGDLCRQFYA